MKASTPDKLWWTCSVAPDHRWAASGSNRVRLGSGCPACAGRQVSVTNNLLNYPELAVQFDLGANGGRTPDLVVATTGKRLWWRCPVADDHRWQAKGADRVAGTGCPACAGQQPSVTNNLLNFPELVAQFDVQANGERTPDQIVAGTHAKLWWTCPVGDDHRWQAKGEDRVAGAGCPACASKRVSVTNSLARYPELAAQFDVQANGCTPEQVVAGTHRRLWWTCAEGPDHHWQATGADRLAGTGCPACAGKRVSVTNSLARHLELAAQFDVQANGGRTPDQIIAGTNERLWWRCPVADDHRWRASGGDRLRGRGCPACAGRQVSVTNSLARHPELAAQFDIQGNGGRTPDQIIAGTNERLWWRCPVADDHRWRASGGDRLRGRGCPACAGRQVSVTNSLARHPELAAQFDIQGNGGRTPDQIIAGTNERLWWRCPVADDHRWVAAGNSRVGSRARGCPACAGRQVSVTNSLARHPVLAAQFDVQANGGRTPDQIVAGTAERLWWRCPVADDHRWRASGGERLEGTGCPACAGKRVSVTNSLARYPELAAQFDVQANGCTPEQVVATTSKRLWWRCAKGPDHRWVASGSNRVHLGAGCPACAGQQLSVTNSLARYPELVAQFDVEANGGRTPDQIVAGTTERLWWRCPVADDHRWRATGDNRVRRGIGCPACAGRQVSVTNNLLNYPELAAQFDVQANGGRTPDQVVAGTNAKLWWACLVAADHRWQAVGSSRIAGSGCPACALVAVSAREVRLAAELAAVLPGLDVDDHRVELPGRRAQHVDVLDHGRRLVVEYDGVYWHAGEKKEAGDRAKTARLTEAGYTVIRVREAPLAPITVADVTVRPTEPIHAVTAAVLDRVAELRPDLLSAAEAAAYRLDGRELATHAAEARLADLRAEAARRRARAADDMGSPRPPDDDEAA
ncbi:Probable Zinc-ribbon domain-containing protein [Geodermatophilus telluris]|uniref:Probable Zinc-ribbon domain-containing protein n=1 Tax=Geodermatophilus telluris TaxID=1190417 RepID=A0A1G6U8A6_9ACTN|nr:Probable Zinc-ribbon domain-containing protein [Geodermatophilus telluris]